VRNIRTPESNYEGFREKQKAIIKEFEKKVNTENFTIVQVQMGPFTRPGILPVVMGNPYSLSRSKLWWKRGISRETYEKIKEKHVVLSEEMENIFPNCRRKSGILKRE